METTRKNCWEVKLCGREPDGAKAGMSGICPAATEKRLDGVHGGKNAGRACWVVDGTLCEGTFGHKFQSCKECDFYKLVHLEEGPRFKLSATLLGLLK